MTVTKSESLTRMTNVRGILLIALTSLCSMGAVCEVNLPASPPRHGPGAVHVTAWAPYGVRASGVQIQLERWTTCGLLLGGCGFSERVESRTSVSNATGEASFETLTPGFWKLRVIGSDEWIPYLGAADFGLSAGETVEKSVRVRPNP